MYKGVRRHDPAAGDILAPAKTIGDMHRVIVNPVRAEIPKKTGPQGG